MKLTLLAGAIALCAVGGAFGNEPPSSTNQTVTFESLDTNSDGRISADEARAHKDLDAGYRDVVSESDKGMTQAEFDTWVKSQQAPMPPPSN